MSTKAEMREVFRLTERRRLVPVAHAVLPLADAVETHRMMEENRHFGKIVLNRPRGTARLEQCRLHATLCMVKLGE